MEKEIIISDSEETTIELGFKFAGTLSLGDTVALYGDLGAGKTEFIKGICKYFNVSEIVSSPTFTIINSYTGNFDNFDIPIFHIDLYRIKSSKELDEIGFKDIIYNDEAIKLVEWAEKADGTFPDKRIDIKINYSPKNEDERIFEILR